MNLDRHLLAQARANRSPLILTIGCGWLAGLLLVGQAWCLSRIIADVFLSGHSLRDVAWLLAGLAGLGLLRAGLIWGGEVAAQRLAGRVKSELRQRLTRQLFALGPAFVRGERTGELTNTVVEGIETLDAYFGQYLPQLANAALVPLTIFVVVVPFDVISGVLLLVTAPLIPLFMVLIGSQAEALTRRQWTALSRMSAHFLDVLQGLPTLKVLNRSQQQAESIAHISQRFRQATMAVLRVTFLSALALEFLATISTALVAVQVGLRLLVGQLEIQQALFVLIMTPDVYMQLRLLGARFHAGAAGTNAARRIVEILATPLPSQPLHRSGPLTNTAQNLHVPPSPVTGVPEPPLQLRLVNVQYTYPDSEQPALHSVSFEIPAGQKVALVGPSGAGKTTLTHLLLRFIEPERGMLLVNGLPLHDIDPAAWRAQLAWIPQRPYLFHASVAENIRLGCPQANLAQIVEAARLAHADSFIEALPRGYDTLVGEQGARLSGGEAQRIALARAFLKNVPLLILDEATAHLDPEHEALIQDSLSQLMAGRTVLIVAHRLSTVVNADQVVVLEGGRVLQIGHHASLLQEEGLYRQLVAAYV